MNRLFLLAVTLLLVLPNEFALAQINTGQQSEQYLLEVVQHLLGRHSKEELFQKTKQDIQVLLQDLDELEQVEKPQLTKRVDNYKKPKKDDSVWLTKKIENIIHDFDRREEIKGNRRSEDSSTKHQQKNGPPVASILLGKFSKIGGDNKSKNDFLDEISPATAKSVELLEKYFRMGEETELPKRKTLN